MAKKNVTYGYLAHSKGFDGTTPTPPPTDTSPNRTPITRLGSAAYEDEITWSEFADTVRTSSLPDATFFLDSSFLDRHEIPGDVWDALLSRRVGITPLIWQELQDWINEPFANKPFRDILVAARDHGHESIFYLDATHWGLGGKCSTDG